MTMWASVRQLMFPREFRIAAMTLPDDVVRAIESLSLRSHDDPPRESAPITPVASPPEEPAPDSMSFLADVATGLWRLRQRMVEPGSDRPTEEMRRPFRHLETSWDALTQAGVRIQDHTGEPFHYGSSIKVIAYEPTVGLLREQVIQTLRPTVYFKNERIQTGEVIVGAPVNDAAQQDVSRGTRSDAS